MTSVFEDLLGSIKDDITSDLLQCYHTPNIFIETIADGNFPVKHLSRVENLEDTIQDFLDMCRSLKLEELCQIFGILYENNRGVSSFKKCKDILYKVAASDLLMIIMRRFTHLAAIPQLPYMNTLINQKEFEKELKKYHFHAKILAEQIQIGQVDIADYNSAFIFCEQDRKYKRKEMEPYQRWIPTVDEIDEIAKIAAKTSADSNVSSVDFVIITPLEEEREAVIAKLGQCIKEPTTREDIHIYYSSDLPFTRPDGSKGTYRVVVMSLLDMGRVQAATAATAAIQRWRPSCVMLVGIAGGAKAMNVKIGDILVADQIVDYELQKIRPQDIKKRYRADRTFARLVEAAKHFKVEDCLGLIAERCPDERGSARHIGPMASGDKSIAFGKVLEELCEDWPELIGVEMEAAGAVTACNQAPELTPFFMIRSASDLADKHEEQAGKWRPYALDVAASYAIGLLKSGPVPLAGES